jgi:Tat protein secretion system quality control protein TatD with DNase activity
MDNVNASGDDAYRNLSPPPLQIEGFRRQIQWAMDFGLPSVIRDRDARRDCMRIPREERRGEGEGIAQVKGVPEEEISQKTPWTALELFRMEKGE